MVYLNQYLKDLEGLKKVEEESFLDASDIEFLIEMIANSNHKGSKFKKVITVTEKLKAQYEKLIKIVDFPRPDYVPESGDREAAIKSIKIKDFFRFHIRL